MEQSKGLEPSSILVCGESLSRLSGRVRGDGVGAAETRGIAALHTDTPGTHDVQITYTPITLIGAMNKMLRRRTILRPRAEAM